MLDTLKLSLDEYEVEPHAALDLQHPTVNTATGAYAAEHVLWRNGKREVRGVKAFHNGERINITLKPRIEAPGTQALCLVQFSVPKMANGGNYHATDHKGTQAALDAVAAYLRDFGIKTNVERASVARLDAAKTLETREPFAGYSCVLGRLQGKRTERRDYGNMFLWGNTRWEACAYDKLEEMRRQKISVAGLPANSLRMELRSLTGRKTREMFGFSSVAELRDGLDHVSTVYRAQMEAQMFRHELPEDLMLSRADLVEQMEAARDGSRYWFRTWLQAWAMRELAPDMEAVKHAARVVSPDRKTAHRIVRELEQGEREGLALQKIGGSKRTWGELYNELRDKVLA
jgi:hypothetical protein